MVHTFSKPSCLVSMLIFGGIRTYIYCDLIDSSFQNYYINYSGMFQNYVGVIIDPVHSLRLITMFLEYVI